MWIVSLNPKLDVETQFISSYFDLEMKMETYLNCHAYANWRRLQKYLKIA
jgi:hypothetical protein